MCSETVNIANEMALTKSVSCDHITLCENSAKQVRWSVDLEEIFYFTPQKPRRKSITEKLREFKDKANDLADRTFRQNGNFLNRNARRELTFRRGYAIDSDIDLNRQWDELFELYRGRNDE